MEEEESKSALDSKLAKTGNAQLDSILGGGLPSHSCYLIEGEPGSGKTTLALGFMLEGVRQGERALYLMLSETKADIRRIAESHGWSLKGLDLHELTPGDESLSGEISTTMYHPSEVELGEITNSIFREVTRFAPDRVVIDSLAEIRYLSQGSLRYRRQLIALRQFFRGRKCTVLMLDDRMEEADMQLQGIARGTIQLERHSSNYGKMRRRLQVIKLRGQAFRSGYHDFIIHKGGLRIYPRLIASEHQTEFERGPVDSGLPALNALLGGGIQRGTSTLIIGAAGTGKSSISAQYAYAACERGEKVAVYVFDETAGNLLERCKGLGMDFEKHRSSGALTLKQVDPAELTPGEFAWAVRNEVDEKGVSLIVIDSLNGYLNAMPDEQYLTGQLHELLSFLSQRGTSTFLVLSQHGLVGDNVESSIETSYLADSIILLRFFEVAGEVRKVISVLKKRIGGHETTIRELAFDNYGVRIGEPLRKFQGVLTGELKYVGSIELLMGPRNGS